MKKRRLITLITAILSFAMLLSACGTAGTPAQEPAEPNAPAASDTAAAGQPESFTLWVNPSLGIVGEETVEALIAEYKEYAPNVDIEYKIIPNDGVQEQLNIAISSNTFPDVYIDATARLANLAVNDVAADLTPYITEDYNYDDYVQAAKDFTTYDGEIKFFLMEIRSEVMVVNVDLFRKAGVEDCLPDAETGGWTREQFEKAVKAIGALGDDVYGFGLAASALTNDKFTDSFIYSDGPIYVDKDMKQFIYDTDKNIKTFEWLVNIVQDESCTVPNATGVAVTDLIEMFQNGEIGVMTNDAGQYRKLVLSGSVSDPFEYMLASYPTENGEPGHCLVNGAGVMIKKQDDAPEKEKLAADFALWLSSGKSEVANNAIYVESGKLSTRLSMQNYIADDMGKKWLRISSLSADNILSIPNYAQIRQVWFKYYPQAYLGMMTPSEAMANFHEESQAVLDAWWTENS